MATTATKRAKKIVSSHHTISEAALTQAYALATIGIKKTKRKPKYDHVDYLEDLIRTDRLRYTVAQSVNILSRMPYFETIAFRGNSGALIAPVLALALDKTMLLVRKDCKEGDHSYRDVEGDVGARTYVIVDDIISSGHTVKTIVEAIKAVAPKAKCLGVFETFRIDQFIKFPKRPLAPPHSYTWWNETKGVYE